MKADIPNSELIRGLVAAALLSVLAAGAMAQVVGPQQVEKLTASDAAPVDWFGFAASTSDGVHVVGAIREDGAAPNGGAVYVYRDNGGGTLIESKLTASDAGGNDWFGERVAVSGDVLVVGASSADGGGVDRGAAYVFEFDGNLWQEKVKLVAPAPADFDRFGSDVAVDGNTILVGASGEDPDGVAYVFIGSDTNWTQQAVLTASDVGASNFGSRVSLDGDNALIGASGSAGQTGSAYAFKRTGTTWTEEQKLVASDGAPGDRFGADVCVSGQTALVGAPNDIHAGLESGSASVFVRSGAVWTEEAKLLPADPGEGDFFGSSVAVDGDIALVGAERAGLAGNTGAAYAFVRSGRRWQQHSKFRGADTTGDDTFGAAVCLDGETALVTSFLANLAAGNQAGAAYVVDLNTAADIPTPSGLTASAPLGIPTVHLSWDTAGTGVVGYEVSRGLTAGYLEVIGTTTGLTFDDSTAFGGAEYHYAIRVLAGVGSGMLGPVVPATQQGLKDPLSRKQLAIPDEKIKGDEFGFALAMSGNTALVGAPSDDGGGSATVFIRGAMDGGWSMQAELHASDSASGDRFGNAVVIDGDLALVGAPDDDDAGNKSGSAYVFARVGATWMQQAKLTASDASADDLFGSSVSMSGDAALVGAPEAGGTGAAYVFVREAGVWTEQARLVPSAPDPGDLVGTAVALDGDAALVGAPGQESAHLFERDGGNWKGTAVMQADMHQNDDGFGTSVALAGGTAIVGAPNRNFITPTFFVADVGAAFVFARGSDGRTWSQQTELMEPINVDDLGDNFGFDVAFDGNILAIGAATDDEAGNRTGATHLFSRCGDVWTRFRVLVAADPQFLDRFGHAVSVSGSRALVGAPHDDDGGSGSGSVWFYDLWPDADGDFVNNLLEAYAGRDWTTSEPGSIGSRIEHGVSAGDSTFIFPEAVDTQGVTGAVKWSDDLVHWRTDSLVIVPGQNLGDVVEQRVSLAVGGVRVFFKIDVLPY